MGKNYQEFTAPEGYYYHKNDVFAKALILPLTEDIAEWGLATEDECAAYQAEQVEKLKAEEEEKQKQAPEQ